MRRNIPSHSLPSCPPTRGNVCIFAKSFGRESSQGGECRADIVQTAVNDRSDAQPATPPSKGFRKKDETSLPLSKKKGNHNRRAGKTFLTAETSDPRKKLRQTGNRNLSLTICGCCSPREQSHDLATDHGLTSKGSDIREKEKKSPPPGQGFSIRNESMLAYLDL